MNPVLKRIVAALAAAALVVLAVVSAPLCVIGPAVVVLIALAFVEYLLLLNRKFGVWTKAPGWAGLGLLVLLGLLALPYVALRHGNWMLLYVIAIVKVSDMGGFALGLSTARLMRGGNHKLCPSVSPGKSWEGLFGSVLAACVVSCLFMPVTHFAWGKALAFGVAAALVGTAGDLVESKFKRWVGVKDSAAFMPAGLGGLLDMLDSLLFAPALLLPFL
ncbi:MAG: phosphatidate cytidylyltransferase [Kiritimatiellia bacterium]